MESSPILSGRFLRLTVANVMKKQKFATVKMCIRDRQYRIKSVTKGLGIYALMGERVLISNGAVTKRCV